MQVTEETTQEILPIMARLREHEMNLKSSWDMNTAPLLTVILMRSPVTLQLIWFFKSTVM